MPDDRSEPPSQRLTRLHERLRRIAIRLGLGGGATAFTRVAYTVPRQIVVVTARHGEQEALWPVDWHMPVSLEPPMYAFSCEASGHGSETVLAAGFFVVNFVPAELEATVMAAGSMSGRDGDKWARLGLESAECAFVAAPRLREAVGWLECAVERHEPWGSRQLVVGRIVHAHAPAPGLRLFHEWRP